MSRFFCKVLNSSRTKPVACARSGLTISTYFSAIKLRWMIDHHENVRKAHDEDDLMFGTVESWILYVRSEPSTTPTRV